MKDYNRISVVNATPVGEPDPDAEQDGNGENSKGDEGQSA